MGKVAAVYNLMPEGTEVAMEGVAAKIPEIAPEGVKIVKMETKPFAFGLKVLVATFLLDDVEGIIDRLEASLQGIEGVQNVESVSVSLI